MKHIKLFEEYIEESVFRMSGIYTAKGLVGQVMQEFKEEIKSIRYDDSMKETLDEINKAWNSFTKEAEGIIIDEVMKTVKKKEEVVYINVKGLEEEWEVDRELGFNPLKNTYNPYNLYVRLPEFVIDIGFADVGGRMKYRKKLEVGSWSPKRTPSGRDIYGSLNSEASSNIEIKGIEVLVIR